MNKHPHNRLERKKIEQKKENHRKGKSPIRRVKEAIKDQETAHDLRAAYDDSYIEVYSGGSPGGPPGEHAEGIGR